MKARRQHLEFLNMLSGLSVKQQSMIIFTFQILGMLNHMSNFSYRPLKIPLSAFIVQDMTEYVQAHASYRFVIQDEEEERPRILVRKIFFFFFSFFLCFASFLLSLPVRLLPCCRRRSGCSSLRCVWHTPHPALALFPRVRTSSRRKSSISFSSLLTKSLISRGTCRGLRHPYSTSHHFAYNRPFFFLAYTAY